ncbi:MAG: asparagine synthetase B family protein [Leptolyngbyaceae cyanobacterium]
MSRPHQVVGFWGVAGQSEQRRLERAVGQANAVSGVSYRSAHGTAKASGSASALHWGVAAWGLVPPADGPAVFPEAPLIAALSASGLNLYPQANGSHWPDAWAAIEAETFCLGREPFGRVPLYWLQQAQVIWFASQLQLLLPLLSAAPEIDLAGLRGYACCSYVPTPHTPIQGIHALPAGSERRWQLNAAGALQATPRSRWQWRQAEATMTDEAAAIAELQVLLRAAMQRQLVNLPNGPVGVFLSGGLDSSIVAALLVQSGVDVRGYSLDFGREEESELPYAQQVADFLQIPLVRVPAGPKQIKGAIAATARALDLPYGDGVTVPLFLLNQAASRDTTVVFNGEHGDQLFAGWTNKPLIASGLYNHEHPTGAEDLRQQYLRTFHRFYGWEHQSFQPAVWPALSDQAPSDWVRAALDPTYAAGLLHRLRRATLMLKGAQNIQPRATSLAQAHGLQVRSPFCDLPLAAWTFRLAGPLCLHNACEKYILKRAVATWLPPEIVWREKRGMGVPLTFWCFNQFWHTLGDWLHPHRLQQEGLWQPDLPTRIVTGQLGSLSGRRLGELLWLLVMWQQWRETVLGEPVAGDHFTALTRSFQQPFWMPPALWRYWRKNRWD